MSNKKLYLTSNDVEKSAKKLVKKLSKYDFDLEDTLVVGVGRGGLIAAQYVAYGLSIKDVATIQTKLYKGKKTKDTKMSISGILGLDYEYSTIILVDDLVDTGTTMDVLLELMYETSAKFDNNPLIIPAVLYSQKTKDDYEDVIVGKYLEKYKGKSRWVEFPWNTFIKGADA